MTGNFDEKGRYIISDALKPVYNEILSGWDRTVKNMQCAELFGCFLEAGQRYGIEPDQIEDFGYGFFQSVANELAASNIINEARAKMVRFFHRKGLKEWEGLLYTFPAKPSVEKEPIVAFPSL